MTDARPLVRAIVTTSPRISVVFPFRNAAATIDEALRSVAAQTFLDFEIIAMDDASTDDSASIVRTYSHDLQLTIRRCDGRGIVAALNEGISISRGEFAARMDADDIAMPERFEAQVAYLEEHADVAAVATEVELFPDELLLSGYREYARWQNGCVTPEEIAANIYVESPVAHPSMMIRRDALQRAGGYRHGDFPEDYELWLRMIAAGERIGKVDRVLLHWRESAVRASRSDPRYSRDAFDRLRADCLARDRRLEGERDVVVWGAGRRTRLRSRLLTSRGIQIAAYIDIDPLKIGHAVEGVMVHEPAWLAQSPRPFVLVYVATHGARGIITPQLTDLGYKPGEDYLFVG